MAMRKGNPVATQHRKPERLSMVRRHAVDSFSLRKLERSLRRVVRGSDRGGGMRNSENNPPHFDRLRWWVGWKGGSRGKMRRMRAGPVVPVGLAWRWGKDSRHKLARSLVVECQTVLVMRRAGPPLRITDARVYRKRRATSLDT